MERNDGRDFSPGEGIDVGEQFTCQYCQQDCDVEDASEWCNEALGILACGRCSDEAATELAGLAVKYAATIMQEQWQEHLKNLSVI